MKKCSKIKKNKNLSIDDFKSLTGKIKTAMIENKLEIETTNFNTADRIILLNNIENIIEEQGTDGLYYIQHHEKYFSDISIYFELKEDMSRFILTNHPIQI